MLKLYSKGASLYLSVTDCSRLLNPEQWTPSVVVSQSVPEIGWMDQILLCYAKLVEFWEPLHPASEALAAYDSNIYPVTNPD
ncbi:hypothetical protein F2P81_017027 [Scophthalmus maximus]|uniref:Uncharacterized protein n=1 Tax=Scophthalmus maximus TaxID=52904 RepID=A0A6A4S516_SCOMX|nr:hypothetical protein F2P81_017027 [Scophthalmus maximus]